MQVLPTVINCAFLIFPPVSLIFCINEMFEKVSSMRRWRHFLSFDIQLKKGNYWIYSPSNSIFHGDIIKTYVKMAILWNVLHITFLVCVTYKNLLSSTSLAVFLLPLKYWCDTYPNDYDNQGLLIWSLGLAYCSMIDFGF